mmetsp:Transcript_26007/g.79079  ORF Transcript_26007/g.79079 Transcript_26007/m.79079 type:complete len:126 (+) Transcript_26007:175-552(+)
MCCSLSQFGQYAHGQREMPPDVLLPDSKDGDRRPRSCQERARIPHLVCDHFAASLVLLCDFERILPCPSSKSSSDDANVNCRPRSPHDNFSGCAYPTSHLRAGGGLPPRTTGAVTLDPERLWLLV